MIPLAQHSALMVAKRTVSQQGKHMSLDSFQIHSPICIVARHTVHASIFPLVSIYRPVHEFVQTPLQPLILLRLQPPVAATPKVHQLLCKEVFYLSVLN